MTSIESSAKAMLAGLVMTIAQIAMAVCLLAPEGPMAYRYSSLIQHDSEWFANIVDRGYGTTVPPVDHKAMDVSNVAFFPAYPAMAAVLHYGLGLETDNALLLTAQIAAWGFWTYFFLFCERWGLSPTLRFLGALSIVAHPAAFFLVAGYSESLFLMALLGFVYWSGAEGRMAKVWTALHGILMTATRIAGIPCAAYPLVRSVFAKGLNGSRGPMGWLRQQWPVVALTCISIMGAGSFFIYCQLRWGCWNIYMLTQEAGWGITPDYLAVFKPSSYHWTIPSLNNPTTVSQMATTLGLLILIGLGLCEVLRAVRHQTDWRSRIGLYFCAIAIYSISVAGVACVDMESMLRYEFCVHAVIVLAFLHFLRQFRSPPALLRVFGMAAVVLGVAIALSLQGWCVWNFTRGNWVA